MNDFQLDIGGMTNTSAIDTLSSSDLDIFAGPNTSNAPKQIPSLDTITETLTGGYNSQKDIGGSGSSFASKVSDFLGFNIESGVDTTEQLRQETNNLRQNTPVSNPQVSQTWDGYSHIGSNAAAQHAQTAAKAPPVRRVRRNKRYYLEKISLFVKKLNESRDTQTTTEVSVDSNIDTIIEEYTDLKQEYDMMIAVQNYGSTLTDVASSVEGIAAFVDDAFPIYVDGLEQAISANIPSYTDRFEQIYEQYGSVEMNPVLSIGASVLATVIRIHMSHSVMNMAGGAFSMENDPELEALLTKKSNAAAAALTAAPIKDISAALRPPKGTNNAAQEQKHLGNVGVNSSLDKLTTPNTKSGFDFVSNQVKTTDPSTGPPAAIHTKVSKPPLTTETANTIKNMAGYATNGEIEREPLSQAPPSDVPIRTPMSGPKTSPGINVNSFIEELQRNNAPPIVSETTTSDSNSNATVQIASVGNNHKKSRGRKPVSISHDI